MIFLTVILCLFVVASIGCAALTLCACALRPPRRPENEGRRFAGHDFQRKLKA